MIWSWSRRSGVLKRRKISRSLCVIQGQAERIAEGVIERKAGEVAAVGEGSAVYEGKTAQWYVMFAWRVCAKSAAERHVRGLTG